MPRNKTTGNLALASFDDIFAVSTDNIQSENVIHLPLNELYPPEFHPFQVNDDNAMTRLTESVSQYGVREPGLARPRPEGGYELLCGNRRKRACELAGLTTMPVVVKDLDNDSATIVMVESNLQQREKILPSERAWAYKVMMEALNHNGIKSENHSYEVMAEKTGTKKTQLFRIIRLTELIAALSDKVDVNKLSFVSAVELSYLSVQEQTAVSEAMDRHEVKPSLSQAIRLKKMKQSGDLTDEFIDEVMSEIKKPVKSEPKDMTQYHKQFPSQYSEEQIANIINALIKDWKIRNDVS